MTGPSSQSIPVSQRAGGWCKPAQMDGELPPRVSAGNEAKLPVAADGRPLADGEAELPNSASRVVPRDNRPFEDFEGTYFLGKSFQ